MNLANPMKRYISRKLYEKKNYNILKHRIKSKGQSYGKKKF